MGAAAPYRDEEDFIGLVILGIVDIGAVMQQTVTPTLETGEHFFDDLKDSGEPTASNLRVDQCFADFLDEQRS